MSGFSLPTFAKTKGKTQKFAENDVVESPKTASPSFFKSLKHRLGKSSRGSQSFDKDDPEAAEDKSYFSKTTGTATMARNINAFAWVGISLTSHASFLYATINCL